MKRTIPLLSYLALMLMVLTVGCRPGSRYTFTGRVYNGLTGEQIKSYSVSLRYADAKSTGHVDSDGVYNLNGLPSLTDYSVSIEAPNFRPLLSVNTQFGEANANTRVEDVAVTYYRDAYLFPADLVAPAAQITVYLADATDRPTGTIRFQPGAGSTLQNEASGVFTDAAGNTTTRVWGNSLDIQQPAILKELTNGVVTINESDFVLGVTYTVSVFGVPSYQIDANAASFVAGQTNNVVLTLSRATATSDALTCVRRNIDDNPVTGGELIISFNQPLELDPSLSQAAYDQLIKGGLSLPAGSVINVDGDAVTAKALVVDDPATPANEVYQRIASIAVDGNRLIFRSTLSGQSLAVGSDPEDVITQVSYGQLGNILVRPKGRVDKAFEALSNINCISTNTSIGAAVTVGVTQRPASN